MRSRRALPSLAVLAVATTGAVTPVRAQQPGGYPAEPTPAAGSGPAAGSLLSRRGELLGQELAFKGTVEARYAGRPVVLQRRERDGTWLEVARATVDDRGAFRTVWRTDHIGRFDLRALPLPVEGTAAAAGPTPPRRVTVFKPARATFFGPGLYGERTACGQRLTPRLQGIAHRHLPCGTLVDVYYEGRSVTVPVVDRGPFRSGHTWDLTAATARRLRFETSDTIGAVRVRPDAAGVSS